MGNVRFDYIDIARGLAMLFVVWWHTMNTHTAWSDGWTMPLFFIIMGVFYKQQDSFKILLVKKINTLIVPLLVCSVPAVIVSLCKYGIGDTFAIICNPYRNINGVSWFLVCMFECYVLYWIVNKIAGTKNMTHLTLCLILSLLGFYTSRMHVMGHRLVLPFYLSTAFTCLGFIVVGHWLSKYALSVSGGVNSIWKILIVLLFVGDVTLLHPKPVEMIWNYYEVVYIQFLADGVLGASAIIVMSSFLTPLLCPLKIVGKLSLLVLLLHGYIFSLIISPLIGNGIIAFIVTIIATTLLAWTIDKWFPFITGRKPMIKLKKK